MKYLYTVPLRDVLADVGVTEDMAYYKVQRRCKKSQGDGSILCDV